MKFTQFNRMALTIICLFSLIANLLLVIYVYERNERMMELIKTHKLLVDTKLEIIKERVFKNFLETHSFEEPEKSEE